MAIIAPSGKLTAQVISELETCLDKTFPTDAIRWAMFEESEMSSFGGVPKVDRREVLTEINLQLAETKAYYGGKKPTRELCPHPDTLKSMLQKKASIRNLANLEYKIDEIRKDFSQLDLAKVVEVINWCRHFFTDPTMGVFIPLEMDLTIGGKVYPGDHNGPASTTNSSAKKTDPAVQKAMEDLRRTLANMPKPATPKRPTSPPTAANQNGEDEVNVPGDLVGRRGPDGTNRGGINIGKKK